MYNCSCGNSCGGSCGYPEIMPFYDNDPFHGGHHHHHHGGCGCGCGCGCGYGCGCPNVDAEVAELFDYVSQLPRSWEVTQRCCKQDWNSCWRGCSCGCGCRRGCGCNTCVF